MGSLSKLSWESMEKWHRKKREISHATYLLRQFVIVSIMFFFVNFEGHLAKTVFRASEELSTKIKPHSAQFR